MIKKPINLGMVDDHHLFRKTLASYLSQQENIIVAFDAPDTGELLYNLKTQSIDILLVDLFMPKKNGKQTITSVRKEYPAIKTIVLSMCTDVRLINDLLDTGIYGYISKADEPEELLKAIQSVSESRIYRNKLFTEALYWDSQNIMNPNKKQPGIVFNEREQTIIQLIWEEKNNQEIADQLYLSVRSIEKIRQSLKEKLDVKSTIGLLKYGLNQNIINLG